MNGTELFSILGVGLIGTIIAVLLRQYRPEFALFASAAASILILMMAFRWLSVSLEEVHILLNRVPELSEHSKLLLKSVGICFLTQLSSGLCKDAGENAIATHIETAGKLMILAVSLPMFGQALTLVLYFLGM